MSQPNTGKDNWQAAENRAGVTAGGMINSAPTTGDKNAAKMLNNLGMTREPDNQAVVIGNSQPSTTGPGHFQRRENNIAGANALHGLGGVPKGFTLNGNK